MHKTFPLLVITAMVLTLVPTCSKICKPSPALNEAQSSRSIEEIALLVVFDVDGNARVKETIKYNFSNGRPETLEIPVISYKLKHILVRLPSIFLTEKQSLLIKNFSMQIVGDNYIKQERYPDGSWERLSIETPELTYMNISLEYTIIDAVLTYSFFSCYDISLESPGEIPVNEFHLVLIVEDVSIPAPVFYSYSVGLEAGTYVYYHPQFENISNDAVVEWRLFTLTTTHFPLHASLTTSPIPGLGIFGYEGLFLAIVLFVATVGLELLFNLFAGREEKIRIVLTEHKLPRVKFPARVSLVLIGIAFVCYHVYFDSFELLVGRFSWSISWAAQFYMLIIAYWVVNISLWPSIAGSNYFIGRGRIGYRPITYNKLKFWLKNNPSLLLLVFMHMLASINMMWGLVTYLRAVPSMCLFWKEPAYLLLSLVLVITSLSVLIWRLKGVYLREEHLNALYLELRGKPQRECVLVSEMLQVCREEGINKKDADLAIGGLSIDGAISLDKNKIYPGRRKRYVRRPITTEERMERIRYRTDKVQQLEKFFGESMPIEPDSSDNRLFGEQK